MPNQAKQLKPDIVKSIFDRPTGKRVSSLFTHKVKKPHSQEKGGKKRLPFGIDIGDDSIKIVQLGRGANRTLEIVNLVVEEIPRKIRGDADERQKALPEILKTIVKDNNLGAECFVTAPRGSVKINFLKLPKMPESEIEKALIWEIGQGNKQVLLDMSWDYIVLDREKNVFPSDQTGILSVVADKKNMQSFMMLLKSAGLKPLAIDVDTLSGIAALDYAGQITENEIALYLDFGAGKTSLSILAGKELLSTWTITVTGNSLTKIVREYCNVPEVGAEALKKTFGMAAHMKENKGDGVTRETQNSEPGDKAKEVANALCPRIENVVQDIEHTFKHFSYQVSQSSITHFNKLILSGGSSYTRDLAAFFKSRLGTNVEIANTLSPFSFGDIRIDPGIMQNYGLKNVKELGPILNVAIGLALRGL